MTKTIKVFLVTFFTKKVTPRGERADTKGKNKLPAVRQGAVAIDLSDLAGQASFLKERIKEL